MGASLSRVAQRYAFAYLSLISALFIFMRKMFRKMRNIAKRKTPYFTYFSCF